MHEGTRLTKVRCVSMDNKERKLKPDEAFNPARVNVRIEILKITDIRFIG